MGIPLPDFIANPSLFLRRKIRTLRPDKRPSRLAYEHITTATQDIGIRCVNNQLRFRLVASLKCYPLNETSA